MIKNRIRTAALAGAIAVATGVSGLAVPAMAQDTNVTQADGSAAVSLNPSNVSEDELRDLTDATAEYLQGWQEGDSLRDIVRAYIETGAPGFDPSEEEAQAAFEAARAEAAAQLATSVENITQARNSIAFALEADNTATEAWGELRDALRNTRGTVNPLVNAVNEANRYQGEDAFPVIDRLTERLRGEEADLAQAYRDLVALQDEVNEQYETAGEWQIDDNRRNYVTREHMNALDALKEAVDAQVEALQPVYQNAIETNREAQRSDVLVRQLYLERATAQRDTLRVAEAIFRTAARQVELRNNDALDGDDSIRALYTQLLLPGGALSQGMGLNLGFLAEGDEAAERGHLSWWTDRDNNDDENRIYREHLSFATDTYRKVLLNSAVWENELSVVELRDGRAQDYAADRAKDKAIAEEAARQAQEAADRAERQAKALEDLAKAIAEGENQPAPAPSAEGSSLEGSSVGGLGIFAALAGIIGLIAAAFPFVSNFLNLNR